MSIYVGVNNVVGIVDQPTVVSSAPTGEDVEVQFSASITSSTTALKGVERLQDYLTPMQWPLLAGTDIYLGLVIPINQLDQVPTLATSSQGVDVELHFVASKVGSKEEVILALDKIYATVLAQTVVVGGSTSPSPSTPVIEFKSNIATLLANMKALTTQRTQIGWHGHSLIVGVGADGNGAPFAWAPQWRTASIAPVLNGLLTTARGGTGGVGGLELVNADSYNTTTVSAFFTPGGGTVLGAQNWGSAVGFASQNLTLTGGGSNTLQFTANTLVPNGSVRVYGFVGTAGVGATLRYSISGASTVATTALAAATTASPLPQGGLYYYTVSITCPNAGANVITLYADTTSGRNIGIWAVDPLYVGSSVGLTIHRIARPSFALGNSIGDAMDSTDTGGPSGFVGSTTAQSQKRDSQTTSITENFGTLGGLFMTFASNDITTYNGGLYSYSWSLADHQRHLANYLAAMNSRGLQVLVIEGNYRNPASNSGVPYDQKQLIAAYRTVIAASSNAAYLDLSSAWRAADAPSEYALYTANTSYFLASEAPNYTHLSAAGATWFANMISAAIQGAW